MFRKTSIGRSRRLHSLHPGTTLATGQRVCGVLPEANDVFWEQSRIFHRSPDHRSRSPNFAQNHLQHTSKSYSSSLKYNFTSEDNNTPHVNKINCFPNSSHPFSLCLISLSSLQRLHSLHLITPLSPVPLNSTKFHEIPLNSTLQVWIHSRPNMTFARASPISPFFSLS